MASKAKNPFQKILQSRKHQNESQPASGEKQPLLGGLFSPQKGTKPSQEHYLGPHDSVRFWDVMMPPVKANMVHGKLIPTFSGVAVGKLHQTKSRITIEVHSDNPEKEEKEGGKSEEDVEASPAKAVKAKDDGTGVMEGLLRGQSIKHVDNEVLHDEEFIVMRIFRPAHGPGFFGRDGDEKGGDDDDEEEERSVSSISLSGVDKEFQDGKWTEAYLYALADIEVIKCRRRTVEMKLGLGEDTRVRDIIFPNVQEASTFCSILESLGKLDTGRAKRRLESFQSRNKKIRDVGVTSTFQLVVDIVSAVRLPVVDLLGTDPFVVVNLGKEPVHRTNKRSDTINPIWTVDSGSLFMLETTLEKFFSSSDGLAFNIYHHDVLGEHVLLGRVFVMQEELLGGNGERVEYPVILSSKYTETRGARLVLRFRLATPNDVAFMKALSAQKKKAVVGAHADEAYVPVGVSRGGLLKREKRITKGGTNEYRVKPGPDPDRSKETSWMTKAQIDAEAQKPSKSWIKAGSGSLGKLYFEVIGCDGLPNMDPVPLHVSGGKTDAYATIIYEDSIVNTDVIMNALCPRWLPWTQRAFVFNIMHPSSQLMLAVLDFNGGGLAPGKVVPRSLDPGNLAPDDPIGRLTIDFSNMRPRTDYTMQFDLATSALVSQRKVNGTVTIRARVEWENERMALIRSIRPPPEIFINVSEHRDWLASRYAIIGECDTKDFSMDTLASFVEELQGYAAIVPVLKSALFTVLLWRGHLPVTFPVPSIPPRPSNPNQSSESLAHRLFKKATVKLPLHSMFLFVGGILLVEDPDLLPSMLFFAVAWILLATVEHENNHPSPWRKKRDYLEHLQVLLFNREFTHSIDPGERKDEVEKYIAEEREREKEEKEEAAREAAIAKKNAQGEGVEEAVIEIETEKKGLIGISINPLQPILYPVQQQLENVVRYLRIVSSFFTGEESRLNFWIVNVCIIIGLLCVGIPWRWLVHWVLRIAVWTFLGPWMKLVDIFFVKGRSREEARKAAKARLHIRYQRMLEARRSRQMRREDALKLKSFKRYMFGSYIVSVPRYKEYRFIDWPLYPSHASPHVEMTPPKISACYYGQHLEGHIIPESEASKQNSAGEQTSTIANVYAAKYGSTEDTV